MQNTIFIVQSLLCTQYLINKHQKVRCLPVNIACSGIAKSGLDIHAPVQLLIHALPKIDKNYSNKAVSCPILLLPLLLLNYNHDFKAP